MSENEGPLAQPEPNAPSAEFDFASSTQPAPRLKRRNLKPKSPEAAPISPAPAAASPSTSPLPPTGATARPAPVGLGTLYYTSGTRPEKEPMKTTPSTSAPSATTTSAPASRPASSFRPTTVSDYRSNLDRQQREQKSIGNVLAILVYCLIGFVVIAASLAGYGAYVITKQLHQQSVTVAQLDDRYAAANRVLTEQLKTTMDTVTLEQSDLAKQQDLILHQQDTINKLMAANDSTMSALRDERSERADETASLRSRVSHLQSEMHDIYHP